MNSLKQIFERVIIAYPLDPWDIPTRGVDPGGGGGGAVAAHENIGGKTYRFAPPPPPDNFDNLKYV